MKKTIKTLPVLEYLELDTKTGMISGKIPIKSIGYTDDGYQKLLDAMRIAAEEFVFQE